MWPMLPNLWRTLVGKAARKDRPRRRPAFCRPFGRRPWLETLEDRCLLSIGFSPVLSNFREVSVPTPNAFPDFITKGPDGNVWFTEDATDNIARITPSGIATEFSTGTPGSGNIITDPSTGTLWFAENAGENNPPHPEIAEMTTAGVVTHVFPLPAGTQPSFVLGPDNTGRSVSILGVFDKGGRDY